MTVSSISRVARTRSTIQRRTTASHEDVLDRVLQLHDVVERDDGPQAVDRVLLALPADDLELLLRVRVAELRLEEEAVELRLGQRERPLLLDRVLRRERRNGAGTLRVTPSTVTWCSAIASSSADWVFGIARLISSTSRTLAKTGPGRNSNSRARWSKTDSPVTSVGWRSGVHWMRPTVAPSIEPASERARMVFAVPGHVLEQDVPARGERREDEVDPIGLAAHDRLDVVAQAFRGRGRPLEALVRLDRRLEVLLCHDLPGLPRRCSVAHNSRSFVPASIAQRPIPYATSSAVAGRPSDRGAPAPTRSMSPAIAGHELIPAARRACHSTFPVVVEKPRIVPSNAGAKTTSWATVAQPKYGERTRWLQRTAPVAASRA